MSQDRREREKARLGMGIGWGVLYYYDDKDFCIPGRAVVD